MGFGGEKLSFWLTDHRGANKISRTTGCPISELLSALPNRTPYPCSEELISFSLDIARLFMENATYIGRSREIEQLANLHGDRPSAFSIGFLVGA